MVDRPTQPDLAPNQNEQTTSSDREKDLDQFYTSKNIAKHLMEVVATRVPKEKRAHYLEPSAGCGAFLENLSSFTAFDIDPKSPGIIQADFLTLSPVEMNLPLSSEVCTIGNPPFGKLCGGAVRFFNKAAEVSDTICFIVPRTFKKLSIQRKLNLNFWLDYEEDLPMDSFIHKGKSYDVACVFQIWSRRSEKRRIETKTVSKYVEFVDKQDAQLAVRRVGFYAGRPNPLPERCSEESHFFLRPRDGVTVEELHFVIAELDFKDKCSTAGPRSVSKSELISALDSYLDLRARQKAA